ncbi:MAG TPA: UvrD-helicase domain-containing protein [Solirubrobacteraceae bacterium]|nr:UvrD-helicase domain-containing protein [Solirubrobacteraceae bacterium]
MSDLRSVEPAEALLEGLNGPQREAVTWGEGPLLVLAGAGSGKTRVLTHRIAHLIYTRRARPGEILAITFTNKAAGEMRERVERLLGHSTRSMWLSTFHSACARILRSEADRLGYTRAFTIYDQADSRRLAKRSAEAVGVDMTRYKPAAIQARISDAKNRLLDVDAYRREAQDPFDEMMADVYASYQRQIHAMNAMDFDDLLLRTVELLERYDDVRARYQASFRYVLVDEYQDTNRAQYRLLQLLVGDGSDGPRNITVVGDDAQSIYGFRGADVRNILDFERDFPEAHVVKLEQNYRSTETILAVANAVIANNRGAIAKELWSDLGTGEQVQLRELDDEHAEARMIVGEIRRLLDEGAAAADVSVLYRTNAMSRAIEDQLVRGDIAYQVIGGTKFYERAEIKDAIAYLTLLANPYDVVSFTRIANSPRRGLGQTSLARITSHATATDVSVWEAAASPRQVPGLGAAAVKALERFMTTMAALRAMTGAEPLGGEGDEEDEGVAPLLSTADRAAQDGEPRVASIAELIEAVLTQSGYIEALEAEHTIEAQGRIENLEQLVEVGREFDERADEDDATLERFLQEIALVADADTRSDDEGLVTLMTLHNAKGTEYPTVFITGLEDGVFPHSRAIDEGGLEEERRLFYVGVTRAMRRLYLTYARRRALFGAQSYGLPSRFLTEIPGELLEEGGELGLGFGAGATLTPSLARGVTSWDSAPGQRRAARAADQIQAFRLGEDVVHAAFGEGVVTGVEPDGVIVVRFAGDGSERKLMAEYAPVTKR